MPRKSCTQEGDCQIASRRGRGGETHESISECLNVVANGVEKLISHGIIPNWHQC